VPEGPRLLADLSRDPGHRPRGGHRAAQSAPFRAAQGYRPDRARLRVPGPGDDRGVPHLGRCPDPARPAPAAHRRPRHPDPAHSPEAASPILIHAPFMNQW
jgi:hypothetical protein